MRSRSRCPLRPPHLFFNPHEELFFFLRKRKQMKLCWRAKEEGRPPARTRLVVVVVSCCLTTENVFHMNSEKTATSQSCYSVSLSSVSFLMCTDYIQSYILLCFSVFIRKALAVASGRLSHCKVLQQSCLNLVFGEFKVLKASSLNGRRQTS